MALETIHKSPLPRGERPALEPCAVAALVCLIVPILGPIASIVLGSVGVRRISRAASPRRGLRMAWAGVVLGWLFLALQTAGMLQLAHHFEAQIRERAETAIVATLEGKPSTEQIWLGRASGGASQEEVAGLRTRLQAALGALVQVRLTRLAPSGWPDTVYTISFTAEYEHGTAFGSADFVMGQDGTMDFTLLARSMTVTANEMLEQIPSQVAKP